MKAPIAAFALSAFMAASLELLPVVNPRASSDPEESRILALENAWNQAEEKKDTRTLNLLLSETLSYIHYDGTLMDKSQFLASARDRWLQPTQISNESIKAHVYGQSAVVTGVYRETGNQKGKAYQRRGRFTDTWIKVGNSWQCVASQSTLIAH